jgi:hypothetical protein
MKSLAILGMSALLLGLIFQCCPSTASEAPPIQPPPAAPATQPPAKEPTAAPMGLDRNNPVPVNHTLTASDGATIAVHGITSRGEEAARLVKEWNMFNEEPGEGSEFVIVSLSVGYAGGDRETLSVSPLTFRAVVGGVITDASFVTGDDLLQGEIFEGGVLDGLLVFEVPHGSTDIVLIYSVLMQGSYYFATQ